MILGGADLMELIKEHWVVVLIVLIILVLAYMYMYMKATLASWMSTVGLGSYAPKASFGMMDQTASMGGGVTDQVGLYNPGTVMKQCRTSPWALQTPYFDANADSAEGMTIHKAGASLYKPVVGSGAQVYKSKKPRMSTVHSDAALRQTLY